MSEVIVRSIRYAAEPCELPAPEMTFGELLRRPTPAGTDPAARHLPGRWNHHRHGHLPEVRGHGPVGRHTGAGAGRLDRGRRHRPVWRAELRRAGSAAAACGR